MTYFSGSDGKPLLSWKMVQVILLSARDKCSDRSMEVIDPHTDDGSTSQQTDMRVQREATLPIIMYNVCIGKILFTKIHQ